MLLLILMLLLSNTGSDDSWILCLRLWVQRTVMRAERSRTTTRNICIEHAVVGYCGCMLLRCHGSSNGWVVGGMPCGVGQQACSRRHVPRMAAVRNSGRGHLLRVVVRTRRWRCKLRVWGLHKASIRAGISWVLRRQLSCIALRLRRIVGWRGCVAWLRRDAWLLWRINTWLRRVGWRVRRLLLLVLSSGIRLLGSSVGSLLARCCSIGSLLTSIGCRCCSGLLASVRRLTRIRTWQSWLTHVAVLWLWRGSIACGMRRIAALSIRIDVVWGTVARGTTQQVSQRRLGQDASWR